MGRARKIADQWMPPRVYKGKSAFVFKPKAGGTFAYVTWTPPNQKCGRNMKNK
jgi:hypothetical protein